MDEVLEEIKLLEAKGDDDELGRYLIQLVKYGKRPLKYENEFRKHFNSSDWYLRKAAVFCLLFALQIDKLEYRLKAIYFLKDRGEDDEIRRWAAAGLAQTYQNTKDKELLRVIIEIVKNNQVERIKSRPVLVFRSLGYGLGHVLC